MNYDLAGETTTLHVLGDEGRWRLHDPRVDIRKRVEEWYSCRGDDFTSPRGEEIAHRELERDDWHVSTRTRTVLRCDRDYFYVHATLDAWEGEDRVFTRLWNEKIPRELC